nr:uncharacterized protein LOC113804520 [Penaeus vannamei]
MWYFGRQAYAVNPRLGADEAVAICGHDLTVVDLVSLERRVLKTGYSAHTMGVAYSLDGSKVYTVAADGLRGPRLVEVNVSSGEATPLGKWSAEGEGGANLSSPSVDPGYVSIARQIQFPTTQGDFAYGYLYMPKNKDYRAPPGTRPPLLVKAHGGPTSAATKTYSPAVQFFTSRGFAILDVDYRGSTGYGTLYRTKLHEMWGVYDVDDVLAGAAYLVQEGLVDPTAWHSTAGPRAATRRSRRSPSPAPSSRRAPASTACQTCSSWRGTRTSSRAATWTASSGSWTSTWSATSPARPSGTTPSSTCPPSSSRARRTRSVEGRRRPEGCVYANGLGQGQIYVP